MKLVFDEPGSSLAAELWDRADVVLSSQLIYPEARAAVAAARRARRITATDLRRAVGRIDELYAEVEVIGLDPDLAHDAGDLAEAHGLRGYDAVHLATAMSIDGADLVLATWDGDLAHAAIAAGRSVAPPPTPRG